MKTNVKVSSLLRSYFEVIVFITYVIRISRIHNAKWWYWYCPEILDLSTVYIYSVRPVLLLVKQTLRNQAGWKPNINCIGIQLLSIADKFFSMKLELLHWTFMNCNFFSYISMLYYLTAICTKVRLQIIAVQANLICVTFLFQPRRPKLIS